MAANGSDEPLRSSSGVAAQNERRKEDPTAKDPQRDYTPGKFKSTADSIDEQLIKSTVGLVTLEDFRKTKEEIEEEQRKLAAKTVESKTTGAKRAKKQKKKERSKLSFMDEGEEENSVGEKRPRDDGDSEVAKKKLTKNPDVDTSFLPDREREAQERAEREELRKNWLAAQERIKEEIIEITYSYWDGSGHRKVVDCKKGDDIGAFLAKCRSQVPELRGTSIDNLMYIKEDLIIPHHYTFYDFIINKARGKSGPLFNFDVHDDVRMLADATKEKDESHAGKVVERTWYNRNKHIFPASRWEVYDPDKDYGGYSIS